MAGTAHSLVTGPPHQRRDGWPLSLRRSVFGRAMRRYAGRCRTTCVVVVVHVSDDDSLLDHSVQDLQAEVGEELGTDGAGVGFGGGGVCSCQFIIFM